MNELAFPQPINPGEQGRGMTLRDYFAAKAMQVVMPSVIAELQRKSYSDEKTKLLKNTSAEACYGMADAMMKARTE